MQTTHKVPGSSAVRFAKYLLSEAARGDRYYTHDGDNDAPTQWHGPEELLRSFGIDPAKPVELRHLGPLMQGFSPITGEPIRPAGSDGTRTAGINLAYAPPKEVSALWATADPYRRAQIEAAHRKAVKSTVQRLEKEVAMVRRKTNGVQRFEKAKGLLATEVVHTTSRLGKDQDEHGIPDPQLHSHIMLLAAERKDGVIAAIESKQLYRSARENGAWYRAQLAANLQELGVGIERHQGNGERYFGVRGVSKELSERWSKRGKDIDQAANTFRRRYGREPGPGELESITLSTRGSKTAASPETVNAAWRALGEEHNQTCKRSEEAFHDWGLHADPDVDLAKELIENVTKESSMVNLHELQAKAYELSAGVCRPEEADRLIVELERSGELLQLEDGTYTTKRLREIERETIAAAQRRAGATVAPVTDRVLEEARRQKDRELKGSLSEEQREALQTITGPGGVVILIGQAGTGKGVVLSAATDAWQKEGYEVIGTAVPGATAMRLQADTRSDQGVTADSLITSFEHRRLKLNPNTVIMLDEAGMLDSERLAKLVRLAEQHGVKLVLAGDAAQLSSIGPGGLFKWLERKVPTAELTEVHRAHHQWEREAWSEVRKGEPGLALARYQAHDRLHVYDTRAEATQAMVENWDQNRQGLPPDQTVMITDSSNEERDAMNALAQDRRAQAGELGEHRVELPDKPYGLAAGDEVIFTKKFKIKRLKRVENGITGTVIQAGRNEDKVTIRTRETKPRDVEVDTEKFSDISLAYAVHIRKGQGLTSETSGILAGGWQTDKEHMYVSLSRARECTDVYISREDLGEQGMDTGAIERLGERMARSRAQEATITKEAAEPTAERKPDTPALDPEPQLPRQPQEATRTDEAAERGAEQPPQIDPATQATPERVVHPPEPEHSAEQTPQHEPPAQTTDHPEPERSAEPSPQHELPDRASEPTAQQPTDTPSPAPRRRTLRPVPQTAMDHIRIDRSSDVSVFIQEREAIDWLEAIMRNQGASHDEFLGEVAKRYQGPEAKKLLAVADREKEQKRQQHLDRTSYAEHKERQEREEQLTKDRETATKSLQNGNGIEPERDALDPTDQDLIEPNIDLTADPQRETAQPVERDPYIQEAIDREHDRQHAWERDTATNGDLQIDQPQETGRDNDRQRDQPTEPEPSERSTDQDKDLDRDLDRPGAADRDPLIEQAIQAERDRQENWERGIDSDREIDRGFGIE
jgi:conjugative relaxase-like TrwC/TraI family protein